MPIPDYQSIMLPLLQLCQDGEEHRLRDAVEMLATRFGLTDDERAELLPSGSQRVFDNRVGWARSYLQHAGLIDKPKRGYFQITDRGRAVLKQPPERIDVSFLDQFEEFRIFRTPKVSTESGVDEKIPAAEVAATPGEQLESAYLRLREELESEILSQVKTCSSRFFERLVIDVLVSMGYGGSRREAGRAIGKSGDGGIDGIINEDRLGLDVIYVQAKRWEAAVGRPEVQKFAGALQGMRAKKGVLITTSSFTKEALHFASVIDSKIVLIDGDQLAQLMVDHGVGVSTRAVYEIKQIDSDYFEE